jgi:hypothetical protein
MSWLIGIDALAVITETTPERIREIALRDRDLDLSWTSANGYCVSRHELGKWKRAIAEDKRDEASG